MNMYIYITRWFHSLSVLFCLRVQMGEEKAVVEQQRPRRVKKTATKFIGVTYISFDYLKLLEGSAKNALGMYELEVTMLMDV